MFVTVSAIRMGEIEVAQDADLEKVRHMVNKLQENSTDSSESCPKLSPDWCFVDCKFNIV